MAEAIPVTERYQRLHTREKMVALAIAGDALSCLIALLTAYWLRFATPIVNYGVVHLNMPLTEYLPHIFLGTALMLVLLGNFRIYTVFRLHELHHHWRIIGQSGLLWVLCYLLLSLTLKIEPSISRLYCVMAGSLLVLTLMLWRKLFHTLISRSEVKRRLQNRVLFVGWSPESRKLVDAIKKEPAHVYEIVGVVPRSGFINGEEPPADIPRLGEFDDLPQIVAEKSIDIVLVTDIGFPKEHLAQLATICEKEMVDFKLIPNVFQIFVSGLNLEHFGGVPVLGVSRLPLHLTFNAHMKRLVDIVGSIVGLILSTPLLLIFGILIKLEDGGPIFYRQRRVGRNGEAFYIYKLRSMRLDAEAGGRVGWTVKNDPRCLRVGAFMRRWNIDEVPQFWNVLRGEMSLVGPRPERPELIANFKHDIRHYNARHFIKPGLTGWAQVNGLRGDTDLTERVKADLYYIENWSLWLDARIMIMTFFKRQNAC